MATIVGLFKSEAEADRAIRQLEAAGFSRNTFGLVSSNRIVERVDRQEDRREGTVQVDHKLGTAGGAAVGGLTGLLVSVGALMIPGIGPVLAAGTLATTLGATAAATGFGAVAGGLVGALTSQGVSEEDAQTYAEGVKRGGILVVVEADPNRTPAATRLLRENGAVELEVQRNRWRAEGWNSFDATSSPGDDYPKL